MIKDISVTKGVLQIQGRDRIRGIPNISLVKAWTKI